MTNQDPTQTQSNAAPRPASTTGGARTESTGFASQSRGSGPARRPGPTGPRRAPGAPGAPGGGGRGRRFYPPRRRVCGFCVDKIAYIDYKDISRLKRFISDRAKIDARRKSGTCARHQRGLSTAIKRARHLAMLPFAPNHVRLNSWRG